jgi:16S rRNA G1207 methylase RsmC
MPRRDDPIGEAQETTPRAAKGDSPIFAETKIRTVPRPQEQLLIEALDAWDAPPPRRVLCTSQGLAQFAAAAARSFPAAEVVCHWLDLYRAELARAHLAATQENARGPQNLTIDCSADFPAATFDLAALPCSAQGEAELTRELLQEAHERLAPGGLLMASSDNPRDRWLHGELQVLFAGVTRREHPVGTVYLARKNGPLARRRNFACELVFRDCGRLIHLRTRPGVFSHRKVDPGARQLMAAMEIKPGDRVLDMGCGSGAVALAAAFRAEGVSVLGVDSHARAVECTLWGARRNGLSNIAVQHSATGPRGAEETFDVVAANPPYYAGFRIAQFFLETARAALKPGGRIYVVSKHPDWYAEHMPLWFSDVTAERSKDYWIARGRR